MSSADTIQKPSPLSRFFLMIKPDKKEIRNVYVYAIFNGLVNLSLPLGIQAIINLIQVGRINTSWIVLVSFVILGIAITGVLQVMQLRIVENLKQKIFVRAAFEFTYRIPRIKWEKLYNKYAPELMNRFFDIVSAQKGLSKLLIDFSRAAIQVIFGLILLSLYHPFFIIFSILLLIILYIIFQTTAKRGLETSINESKHKYQVAHWLEELARINISFKLAGKTKLPLNRVDSHLSKYVESRENHFKILVLQYSLMIIFKVLIAAGILIIGGILVMEQKMNIGQFVAAEIIVLLILSSVEKLIVSLEEIYDILTSLEKIGQITDIELENEDGISIENYTNDEGLKVELNNFSFQYPKGRSKVLKNLNLTIESGENILITGDNDSGKTTLMVMLAGLYEPQEGTISFNGFPIGNIDISSLRSVIGDCLMIESLFKGTLLENISLGRERATFENVCWAIENLGLSDLIKELPQGLNTEVNPEGKEFSKSIIQKILLARCIADKPKLLLIKDAFSSIQSDEKNKIFDFLLRKEHNWTIIYASSNPIFAEKMDKIVILNHGEISNIGKYNQIKKYLK